MSKPGDVHVMPNFGRPHEPSSKRWCRPQLDAGSVGRLWIHEVPN